LIIILKRRKEKMEIYLFEELEKIYYTLEKKNDYDKGILVGKLLLTPVAKSFIEELECQSSDSIHFWDFIDEIINECIRLVFSKKQ